MKFIASVLGLASLCTCPSYGQSNSSAEDEMCSRYADVPLPAEAVVSSTPNKWPACESYKIYSGIGTAVDYAAARKCAWVERATTEAKLEPEDMINEVLGGSAMLAVLYANGEGVEQNKLLALRLACEVGMPLDGLKKIQESREEAHLSIGKFERCDFAYTTIEMNFCAKRDSEIAAQNRKHTLDGISASWPRADQDAFAALQNSAEDYVIAHGRGEVDQGGTIRGLRTNGVEERQRAKFLEAVQAFESGHLPKAAKREFEKSDADLNETYKAALALAAAHKNDYEGQIQPEGIQDAERAWLKYRDAWIVFAEIHYPNTDPDAWRNLLTRNRVWSLRATMCEVGWGDPGCKPR